LVALFVLPSVVLQTGCAHGNLPVTPLDQWVFRSLDGRPLDKESIDQVAERLMADNAVEGLALALVQNGRVVHLMARGRRDRENNLPLGKDSIMYAASLTKAAFAYVIMQLIDEGRIDLDQSIAGYLPQALPDYPPYADLRGDERWRALTPRILLTHTSGFQNFRWIDPDQRLRFHRNPGERFGYSGEGINLLQFVLEHGLGLSVAEEMQRRVFDRFAMKRTSMTWRTDFSENVAHGYTAYGERVEHDQRENVRAAGSIDTTIDDWSRFIAGVSRGDGISAASKVEMTRLQIEIDSVAQFPTLRTDTTDAYRGIRLGYGLGWGVFRTPFGDAYFKEGSDDGTTNYVVCIDAQHTCVLIMSNSNRTEGIIVPLLEYLLGPINLPAAWEGYRPYDGRQ
jgi:CubicO group peptidase (beta-lactamase class C family)